MQVDLTVRDAAGDDHDVAIRSQEAVRLGAVAALIRAALAGGGTPNAGADAALGGADPDDVIGSPDLPVGSVLSLAAGTSPNPAPRAVGRNSAALRVISGRDAGTVIPLGPAGVLVGRGRHCDLTLADDAVSREHLRIDTAPSGFRVEDLGSTNGSIVEGDRLPQRATPLEPGANVRVGDTVVAVDAGGPVGPSARVPDDRPATLELTEPEPRARPAPVQWVAALVPAFAGGAVAWFTHSLVFLLFTVLSPVMLLSTALGDRGQWRRSRRRHARARRRYEVEQRREVAGALARETTTRRTRFPDPVTVASDARQGRVWHCAASCDPGLTVRTGVADLPAATRVRQGGVERCAGTLTAVPVLVDLGAGARPLAGPVDETAGLVRWWLVQLLVRHPPHALRLVLVLADESRTRRWHWARWLPHLGTVVGSCAERPDLVAAVSAARATPGWTVAVIDGVPDDDEARRAVARLAVCAADPARTDLAVVLLDDDRTAGVAGAESRPPTAAHPDTAGRPTVDAVSVGYAERVARALAGCSTAVVDRSVPTSSELLELLGLHRPDADTIRRGWDAATSDRPATVIGVSKDGSVELDLARHGPHALVVGTTGSGKSELLRSWVLALALRCPPSDVTFVLVDFKGGATFGAAADLPHVVGTVTDLDAALTQRALRSLTAELRRREQLFATFAAEDFDQYRVNSRTPPLARLVVMVDEFAALADELPDVLRGLIATAQRGRSLGIHLVLATQRPGAAVTPEIRANTSLRVALRTVEHGESHDVIGTGAAAVLPRDVPGRAIVATGEGTTEFQTARVDDPAHSGENGPVVELLGPWRRRRPTTARHTPRSTYASVVSTIRLAAASQPTPDRLWAPPLPELVPADSVRPNGRPATSSVPFAVVDRPDEQRQDVLTIDLDDPSSWLVIGAPRSGRTSALVTVVRQTAARVPADRLQIYLIDGVGDLYAAVASLPHVATALGPGELATAGALLARLARHRPDGAMVLIAVDGIDDVLRGDEATSPSADSGLAAVVRAGTATVLLAGSRELIAARVSSGFEHRVMLRLPDVADYQLAGVAARHVPSSRSPGRAVLLPDSVEAQLVLSREGSPPPTPPAPPATAALEVATHRDVVRLRPLPGDVQMRLLRPHPERLRLGLAGEAADELSVDPFRGKRRWLVAGPSRSGRSTALCTLIAEAGRVGLPVTALAPPASPVRAAAAAIGATVLDPTDEVDAPPSTRTLVVVDDVEALRGLPIDDALARWAGQDGDRVAFVVAGQSDDLITAFGGLAAEVRRARSGILLRPGPLDGEVFGFVVPAQRSLPSPPGRGFVLGDPAWRHWPSEPSMSVEPDDLVAVQIAHP